MAISSLISQKRSFGSVFFWGCCASGLGLVLLGLAWLVPNHYRPWPSFHSEMMAFIAVTLLFVGRMGHTGVAVALPRLALWLLLALAIPWLQLALGVSPFAGDAITVSFYLVGLLAAIAVGYGHGTAKSPIQASLLGVMHVLWIGALLSACIGVLQYLGLEGWFDIFMTESGIGERVLGNLAQTNHLSTLLLMGVIGLAYLYEERRIGGPVLVLSVAFLTTVVVLTVSRSGLFSILAVVGYFVFKRRDAGSRLPLIGVVVWAATFLLATWVLPYLSQILLIGERGLSLEGTSGRTLMWKQIGYGILQQPFFGYGWNLTVRAQMPGAAQFPGELSTDYAHNMLLDLLAWNGIPLGLVFAAAGAYWFISRCRRVYGVKAVYAFACLVPLAVHSMVEYPFAYGYFLLPAGFMVGVVEASMQRSKEGSLRMGTGPVAMCTALWIAIGGYFVYEYFLIEEDFRMTRFENMRIGRTPESYEIPSVWVSSHMAAMLRATRTQPVPGMDPEALANLARVSSRFGYAALNYRYALALGLNGDPEGAAREMKMIRGMYGKWYYRTVSQEMREQAESRYPQLKAVQIP